MNNLKRFSRERILTIILFFNYLFFVTFSYYLSFTLVYGESMEPSYITGDFIIINTNVDVLEREDFVMVDGEKLKELPDTHINYPGMAKRVVGLPGELVVIYHDQLYVDGVKISEDYILEDMKNNKNIIHKLASDEYFLMGDNRNLSLDSRHYGPVKHNWITGKKLIHLDNFDKENKNRGDGE